MQVWFKAFVRRRVNVRLWLYKFNLWRQKYDHIRLPIQPEGPGRVQRQRCAVLDVVGDVFQLFLVDVDVVFCRVYGAALSRRVQLQIWGCRNRHLFVLLAMIDVWEFCWEMWIDSRTGGLLMLTHLPFGRLGLPRHRQQQQQTRTRGERSQAQRHLPRPDFKIKALREFSK